MDLLQDFILRQKVIPGFGIKRSKFKATVDGVRQSSTLCVKF